MHVKTRRVVELFEEISRIPRCSKHEEAISRWFQGWADSHGFPARRDRTGNLKIAVPASPGCERAPAVVLQGHLDMVCEKMPGCGHDFSRDPIRIIREGDWIHAQDTTLGADNGVALALSAALAEDSSVRHPQIELLFTVDEETGLTGAKALERDFLRGRLMINLDSETEGVFTVGCAGGRDVVMRRDMRFRPLPDGDQLVTLCVGGLSGGHSGIDIHRHRANACKLLARALNEMLHADGLDLIELGGGTKRNAIPRDAHALLACLPSRVPELRRQAKECEAMFRSEYAADPSLFVSVEPAAAGDRRCAADAADARLLVNLLLALPHGVVEMAPGFPDLVMSSSNLAIADVSENGLNIITSQRCLTASGLEAVSGTVRAVAALAGAQARTESEYPPWTPDLDSPLLSRCREAYRRLFQREAEIRAIHAGLECAVIGRIYPGMDMISVGPTIENAHSPAERLNVPSLSKLWDFLVEVLRTLAATAEPTEAG